MDTRTKLRGRIPLPNNSEITIDGIRFTITDTAETVSAGSTCLVYHGYTKDMPGKYKLERMLGLGRPVIIKEFYPYLGRTNINRDPDTNMLIIPEEIRQLPEYQKAYQQFMQSLSIQKNLADSDIRQILVPVELEGSFGDSYYNVSEYTRGDVLTFRPQDTLTSKLLHFITLLYPFEKLHQAGYVMLDIKPENFFWGYEDVGVLIIDTDSLIRYEEELIDRTRLLFSNTKYAPPELQYIELFIEEGNYKAATQLLSPYANMYSLAVYLYELMFEKPFLQRRKNELEDFLDIYYQNPYNDQTIPAEQLRDIGKQLLHIFDRVLVDDPFLRSATCYESVKQFIEDIDKLLTPLLRAQTDEEPIGDTIDDLIAWAQRFYSSN